MRHRQLYEIKDTDGAGIPEVVMSRYNEGNDDLDSPNFNIVISSYNNDWVFDTTGSVEDVDGDGDRDYDDASYYTIAAKLVTQMFTLRSVDLRQRYSSILISFGDSPDEVVIAHYQKGNTSLSSPDFIVTASNPDSLGRYRHIKDSLDADGDGDIDKDDELIYKQLATSFASMRDLEPDLKR
ncbi:hypothetical protein [Pseudomonas graminis]